MVDNIEQPFEDAKSSYNTFELPTGYLDTNTQELIKTVVLKEMTGEEEDLLANPKINAFFKMNKLMQNCTESIGQYTDKEKVADILKSLVANDRHFIIYKIRQITFGDNYKFQVECPECKKSQVGVVKISSIEIPSLKDPKKRLYTGILPKSGMEYCWKVIDGKAEDISKGLNPNASKESMFSIMLLQRVQSLGGSKVDLKTLKKLSSVDRSHLRNEIIETEGRVDDNIDMECKFCGTEFDVEADIAKQEFFFPN